MRLHSISSSRLATMTDLIGLFGGHFMSPVPDPYPVYARLRREHPVLHIELPLGPTYLVTRYEDALSVLKDAHVYSSAINAKGIGLVMGRTILEMDGKEHARHRNIVSASFLPKALQRDLPPAIEATAHRLIDRFANDGHADLVAQFARTFPVRVIAYIMGVPIEDYETFQKWSFEVISFTEDPPRGLAAAQALIEFLHPIIEDRRARPDGDLLSTLVHFEVDGQRLSDEEVYSFLRLLLPAGAETTYRLIGSTLFALLHHPDQLDEVRSDRSQLEWVIEEGLRWEAPVQFASRNATAAAGLGDVELSAGAQVLVALGSANRDESQYEHADAFDVHRRRDDHLAFGFGRHFCLGSHLARLEARIALNALFDRLPNLRLDRSQAAGVFGLAFRSPDRVPVLFDA